MSSAVDPAATVVSGGLSPADDRRRQHRPQDVRAGDVRERGQGVLRRARPPPVLLPGGARRRAELERLVPDVRPVEQPARHDDRERRRRTRRSGRRSSAYPTNGPSGTYVTEAAAGPAHRRRPTRCSAPTAGPGRCSRTCRGTRATDPSSRYNFYGLTPLRLLAQARLRRVPGGGGCRLAGCIGRAAAPAAKTTRPCSGARLHFADLRRPLGGRLRRCCML